MAEGTRITLGELAARQRREREEYLASPEGQEALRRADEKSAHELLIQSIVEEGHDAATSGLTVESCPYPADTTERRLWIYGFDNPPADDDEEGDDEDDDDETD